MTDYQKYKELISAIGEKKIQIVALQNRISNVDSEPELNTNEMVEHRRVYDRFMQEYPFFVYRQGASGTLETKTLFFYKALGSSTSYSAERLILGKATGGSTYPVCRTMIARNYTNSAGKEVTTTPNIAPTGNISASSSFAGHFTGHNNWNALVASMKQIPIGELVKTQEDMLDSNPAYRAAHYERSLFVDLESITESPNEILEIQERAREEVRVRLNGEIAIITEEVSTLTEERITIEQKLDEILTQSQTQLQEKQEALNRLEETLADLEKNNTTALQEITALQEEITRLEKELEDLNNANPDYSQNLQELENLRNQKAALEAEIAELESNLANQSSASAELQAQITQLESQKQQLEEQLANLADSELLARRNQLNAEIAELQRQITNAENSTQELEAAITALQAQKTELEATLQEKNTQITELQSQKVALQAQITPKEQELEALQEQITQAQSDLDALKAQNAELESNLTQKREELQTLKDAIANYDVNTLNSELQALLAQIPQKQQELANLEALLAQNQGQKDVLDELQTQIAEKQAELDSYADSEIYKAQQTLESLKKKLEAILNSNSFVLESDLKDLHERALKLAKELKIEICQSQSGVEYIPQNNKPKNFVGFRYIAKDGERLDSIVYAHYGTLNLFQSVLECNPNLLNHQILRAGEIVWLPSADTKAKSLEGKLWS